ncbi:MAG: 2,3-bisphosphoglycerate-independent phosphoglycerate mutase [Neisseriales bacterium]|nr:MAG: 2,3-bisphosphoglycerate-independent phosphoglycerate mutase [Neisseriales bacterium]
MVALSVTPVLLLILDGFGHRMQGEDNAIYKAHTPFLDALRAQYAYGTIATSGQVVGLPSGQFGNSEVGHINIGAGRVVLQDISRIDEAIQNNTFTHHPVFVQAFQAAQHHTLHILGLLSDGGVHSHEKHIHTLIHAAQAYGVNHICLHAFLDGRDVPPRSALTYLEHLNTACRLTGNTRIATLCGRYWAMDRDQRWDRIERAYRLIVEAQTSYHYDTAEEAIQSAYQRGENDEFIAPSLIGKPCPINSGDAVLFMNFRADRARAITEAISLPIFNAFPVNQPKLAYFATLTTYSKQINLPCAYPAQAIRCSLGEYIASLGLHQLRIAETEKFAHVTYFFNGGQEEKYPHEVRILVPSPQVATYDLQPQMSAFAVTDQLIQAIASQQFAFIVCNFANGDMVGHSGSLDAAVIAVETLDQCLARCVTTMRSVGGEVIICADHGNCEQMYDEVYQQPHTQHTTNPSPFYYIGRLATIRQGGALQDVAPSVLAIMGLPVPKEMTGRSLIVWP